MILMGEELRILDRDEIRASCELLEHSPGLPDREERIFGTPDELYRCPDAAVHRRKAVEESEVHVTKELELTLCHLF